MKDRERKQASRVFELPAFPYQKQARLLLNFPLVNILKGQNKTKQNLLFRGSISEVQSQGDDLYLL